MSLTVLFVVLLPLPLLVWTFLDFPRQSKKSLTLQDKCLKCLIMYAKIFSQIFDSSIAENYQVRHVFEDLLKLCDLEGVVDMTLEAISRRTNVPLDQVRSAVQELCKPDQSSRSKAQGGRRLIPVDSGRDWGWIIVNYEHYRGVQDEESRRVYFRDAKRKQRDKSKKPERKRLRRDVSTDNGAQKRNFEAGYIDRDGQHIRSKEPGPINYNDPPPAPEGTDHFGETA